MRAMTITQFGPTDHMKLADVEQPPLGEHDALIEVRASSLNPVDTKVRSGAGMYGQLPLPLVPGYDVSGVVLEVGPSVTAIKVGDEVFASPSLRRWGAHAERVVIDARSAAIKPKSLTHEQAAALPLVTLTAWESLFTRAQLQPGETVLLHAGAGGVGHVAVQLAKDQDCRVITTASREDSIALCKKLGADVVINYKTENVVERVLAETDGAGVPVAFDTVGGSALEQCMDAVAVNGRVSAIVYTKTDTIFDKLFRKSASLHLEFMGVPTWFNVEPERQAHTLAAAAALADAGKLRPHVHKTITLADLPAAHAEIAAGHVTGKIVVLPR